MTELTWKLSRDGTLRSTTEGWVIELDDTRPKATLHRRGASCVVFTTVMDAVREAESLSRICAEWVSSREELDFDCPETGRHWQYTRKGWWICKGTPWRFNTGGVEDPDGIAVYDEGVRRYYIEKAMSPQGVSRYIAEIEKVREEGRKRAREVIVPRFQLEWVVKGNVYVLEIREMGAWLGSVSKEALDGKFVSRVYGGSRSMRWISKEEAMNAVEWWAEQVLRSTEIAGVSPPSDTK